jgi:3-oxoacyl-(acyl-carrier-protein) synthase
VEAIFCEQALANGLVPPTTNLEHPDPKIALNLVYGSARSGPLRCAISTASGFGGVNVALVLKSEGS